MRCGPRIIPRAYSAALRVAATSPTSVVATEDIAVADADRQRVIGAMNRLSESDRLVIALRHFEDLSEREMADALRCRSGTVKSRLSRAMSRLRLELARTEADDG